MLRRSLAYLPVAVVLYCAAALFVFWVRHPSLTQMETLKHFVDAVLWRGLP